MVKLKATKRTATGISQFVKPYNLYVPGERALRTEKKKRLPPYELGRCEFWIIIFSYSKCENYDYVGIDHPELFVKIFHRPNTSNTCYNECRPLDRALVNSIFT